VGRLNRTKTTTAFAYQAIGTLDFPYAMSQLNRTVGVPFRNALHGNGKPDFAVISRRSETDFAPGNCSGDHTPVPRPAPPDVCPEKLPNDDCAPTEPRPCFSGICCHCTDINL